MSELRSRRLREGADLPANDELFRPWDGQARRRHHDHVLPLQSEPQAKIWWLYPIAVQDPGERLTLHSHNSGFSLTYEASGPCPPFARLDRQFGSGSLQCCSLLYWQSSPCHVGPAAENRSVFNPGMPFASPAQHYLGYPDLPRETILGEVSHLRINRYHQMSFLVAGSLQSSGTVMALDGRPA